MVLRIESASSIRHGHSRAVPGRNALERENQLLRAQIARASDLRTIELIAREELGMVPARRVHFAHIPERAQGLALPLDANTREVDLPFSNRWDLIREQFTALFGEEFLNGW